jgi:hypothetical protein
MTETVNDGPVFKIDHKEPRTYTFFTKCKFCNRTIQVNDPVCQWCASEVDGWQTE